MGFQTYYNLEFDRYPGDSDVMQAGSDARVFGTYLTGEIEYLPNSRSSFRLSVSGSYRNSNSEFSLDAGEIEEFSGTNNSLSLYQVFDIYYYISSKLRLELTSYFGVVNDRSRMTFENTMPEEDAVWNYNSNNLTVRLVYSFF